MKAKMVSWVVSFLLIVVAAGPCFGQKKVDERAMTVEEIKARVAEAHAKNKRLIVTLKNGSSVSGVISLDSENNFTVKHTHDLFGDGESETIRYSDVARMKGRNPFVKVIKDVGMFAVVSVFVAAILPVALVSGLLGRPIIPDC